MHKQPGHPSIRSLLFLMLLFAFPSVLSGQNDTIISESGDRLIGEIESLEKGVLLFDSDYADKDFSIEWDKIEEVRTQRTFLIILTDGRRFNGSIHARGGDPPVVLIKTPKGSFLIEDLLEIMYLKPVEKNVIDRLDASIEVGYTFTRAQNHHQFQTRSSLGYTADYWGADASLDVIRNVQENVDPTRRTDANIGARYIFARNWYILLSNNFLQNDEQKLKLRSTTNLSASHLFINTARSYWAGGLGTAYNYESFTSDAPDERSWEGLIVTELNLFAYEDISLLTTLKIYPGLTLWGRIRSDFRFDVKFDLPLDFYIRLGFTHNFDNRPTEGASTFDYVIQTTFGWDL